MSQEITCLITNENIQINEKVVHFVIRGITFVPFEILGYSISSFIEEANNSESITDLFNYYKKFTFDELVYDEYFERHSLLDLINFIETNNLQNYLIQHSSDWADIPVDNFFIYINNGKIVKESLVFDEEIFSKQNFKNIDKYCEDIGLNFNWIGMSKFHSYQFAEKDYLNK